jgi:hypothetical protein
VGIYWLASYPKSGNTWLRAFLANYRSGTDRPADINELGDGWTAVRRATFDEYVGLECSSLTESQIEYYRPLMYERMALDSPQSLFFKVHDAYIRNGDGEPIFAARATAGAIYLIRNPMDVAVSYAHHQAKPIDEIILQMASGETMLAGATETGNQLPQRLTSWSGHVRSWAGEPGLNIHIVRYEDLVRHPCSAFSSIIRFSGLEFDEPRLRKAIEFSAFDSLRAQEKAHGFREKQPAAKSFFREGKAGSWRNCLNESQVRRLIGDHHDMMLRFGYLSPANELLV